MKQESTPALLILNQMAGPLTWELADDLGKILGSVALLTGHPDTLYKGSTASVRVFAATSYQRSSFVRRVRSWMRYLWDALLWVWSWPGETPLLLYSNPPILPWLGWILRVFRGQRYAVVIHDIYPDILVRLGLIPMPFARIWYWCNRRAYQSADLVITLGERMADALSRQFDPGRTATGVIHVIYPWADTEFIQPLPKDKNPFAKEHGQENKLTAMYSGNMGIGHDIETILRAALCLRDEPSIHFMFIGDGPKRRVVEDFIKNYALNNVTLLQWQPEEMLPYSLTTADVSFVSLEPELSGLAVPSKFFYYLAAGSPVILISDGQSEIGDIIEKYECGWVCQPDREDEIVQHLSRLKQDNGELERLKRRSREVAERIGSRKNNSIRMSTLLANWVESCGC
ncbi:MAG: glycosyltransferase family 4 protein [Candidatus Methanomethylicaceae archaeon]